MQPDRHETAQNWLATAADDLQLASELVSRMPNVACFHAQQAAEKSLKGWLVAIAGDVPRVHLIEHLLAELNAAQVHIDDPLRQDALSLGQYYIATRYPDALAGASPRSAFMQVDAEAAVEKAERVYVSATAAIRGASA